MSIICNKERCQRGSLSFRTSSEAKILSCVRILVKGQILNSYFFTIFSFQNNGDFRIQSHKGFDNECKIWTKTCPNFDLMAKALMNSNFLYRHYFEVQKDTNVRISIITKLYAERDFSLKNAKAQRTKDFRFYTSVLERLDF